MVVLTTVFQFNGHLVNIAFISGFEPVHRGGADPVGYNLVVADGRRIPTGFTTLVECQLCLDALLREHAENMHKGVRKFLVDPDSDSDRKP